jgi:hypothetical protein
LLPGGAIYVLKLGVRILMRARVAIVEKLPIDTLKDRLRSAVLPLKFRVDCPLQPCAYERFLRPQ